MINRTYSRDARPPALPFSKIIVAVLVIVCLGLGYLAFRRYFQVRSIICTQGEQPCAPADQELVDHLKGRFMLEQVTLTLLGKKVAIRKKFPQTVIVTLEQQDLLTPIYQDESRNQLIHLYTDRTAHVVPTDSLSSPSATLAITDLTLTSITGSVVLSDSQYGVYTELLAFAKSQAIESIVIRESDTIEIHTARGLTALVSTNGLTGQLHSLQLLLASPTIEQKPARVDMRFDRPVLQYL